jgi:hypothetical protein
MRAFLTCIAAIAFSAGAAARELRGGRALAIIQSARQLGTIRVVAHSEGFQDATVEIQVKAPAYPISTLP